MDSQLIVVEEKPGVALAEVRHCSVCFAVIDDTATVRRSLEGHCYCERCGAGFFKKVKLQSLRTGCCYLPENEAIPA
ncbi:MAG: hypothetical protein V3571_05620 [Pseudodesulfovibrio sp.]